MELSDVLWYTAYGIVIFPTTIGNGLIIVSLLRFQNLRSNMNILIGNLAVSDLIVGAVLAPLDMCVEQFNLKYSKALCLGVYSMFVVSLGSSCINLLLVSVERFFAIAYPLQSRVYLTKNKIAAMILTGWAITLLGGSVPLYENTYTIGENECSVNDVWTKTYRMGTDCFVLSAVTLNFVLYSIVVYITMRAVHGDPRTLKLSYGRAQRELRQVITMSIVLGAFVLCWLPYMCVTVIKMFRDTAFYEDIQNLCLIPGFLNSGINWIIYGYRKQEFRHAFVSVIKCESSVRRQSPDSGSLYTSSWTESSGTYSVAALPS